MTQQSFETAGNIQYDIPILTDDRIKIVSETDVFDEDGQRTGDPLHLIDANEDRDVSRMSGITDGVVINPQCLHGDLRTTLPFLSKSRSAATQDGETSLRVRMSDAVIRRRNWMNSDEATGNYQLRSVSHQVDHSKPLPPCIQSIFSMILGIKSSSSDKNVIAKIVFILTILLALLYATTFVWIMVGSTVYLKAIY